MRMKVVADFCRSQYQQRHVVCDEYKYGPYLSPNLFSLFREKIDPGWEYAGEV